MGKGQYTGLVGIIDWLQTNPKAQQSDFVREMMKLAAENARIEYEYHLFTQVHIVRLQDREKQLVEIPWTDAIDMSNRLMMLIKEDC